MAVTNCRSQGPLIHGLGPRRLSCPAGALASPLVRWPAVTPKGWFEETPDFTGAPEGIRTPDPQIRSLVLYPAELPAQLQEKGGAPEEIRTPDPQIRSLIIFNSLTFLHRP